MDVIVHQFDGVSTLDALPLAAGLLVATARRDARVAAAAALRVSSARRDPDAVVAGWGRPDVLAFSAYVWNERYSLEVARRARARHPGAFVLFGGPSVPRRADRAAAFLRAHRAVDALAFGEGELTFRDVLRALLDGRPLVDVPGLALRAADRPEGALVTAARDRLADFGDTASPYLDGTFDALVAAGAAPGAAIIETNRGCPFACTFCDWGQAVASRVHELPLDRLHAELRWVGERRIPYVYIVDANYGMRRRDVDIVHEIGRIKAATGFPHYVFFHLTKNATERHLDVVLALRQHGIATHLALSAQDFEPRVLVAVKRDNIKLERALALRRVCHERGIPTFNELILGLPEQTYDSFADSMVKAVTPYPGDAFNLYLARVLENAEMASPEHRARYGIVTREVLVASFHRAAADGHVAEVEEVVVGTDALPPADWRRAFKLGFFLAAAHNLRLLDVVLQVAWRAAGVDLRRLVEGVLAAAAAAPDGSALARVDAVLERYAGAVLDGHAMVLPADGTGDHLWAVEDAVVHAALVAGGGFHAEVEAWARAALPGRAGALVAEAARYQGFIAPVPGRRAPRIAEFAHDFAAWRREAPAADGPPVMERPARLRFTPSPTLAAAADARAFLLAYLGAAHARAATGTVVED
jgi:radical SAM superfamily enzyme YgiQ (UPF0313 family)